jgi:ADP-ribose pyrophosphatase
MSQRGPREEPARKSPSSRADATESWRRLAETPSIAVEVVRELGRSSAGFLQVREVELQNRYDDGSASSPYRYFLVERAQLDAVALVLYRRHEDEVQLVLRSQLRPPLAFRGEYQVPLLALGTGAVQWEIPAGLMEPGESGVEGLFTRASAEAREEVGLTLAPERFTLLGPPTSLSPGLIAEKLHFVCAEVLASDAQGAAAGDGHAVEERSVSLYLSLSSALRAIEQGLVHDIKTEIGIRRLADKVESGL